MPNHDYMTPEPREEKLPAWAQDKLRTLRMRYNESLRVLAEMSPENGLTNTIADPSRPLRDGEPPFYLPNDTSVEFVLDGPRREKITCRVEEGTLSVHGSATLVLTPRSANLVSASVVKR